MSILHGFICMVWIAALAHGQSPVYESPIRHVRETDDFSPVSEDESRNLLGRPVELKALTMGDHSVCWTIERSLNDCRKAKQTFQREYSMFVDYMGPQTLSLNIVLIIVPPSWLNVLEPHTREHPSNGTVAMFVPEGVDRLKNSQKLITLFYEHLSRQWFADLLTPKSLANNGWIWTGLQTYFQHFVTHEIDPKLRSEELMVVRDLQAIAFQKELLPISQPLIRSKPPIAKAQCIMRMIWHVMGPTDMKKALQAFAAKRNTEKVILPRHFFDALASATSDEHKKQLFEKFLITSWVTKRGYPVIDVELSKTGIWKVSQISFGSKYNLNHRYNEEISLNYATKTNRDYSDTLPSQWFKLSTYKKDLTVESLGKGVIFNKQQTGYYRVNYDNWSGLILLSESDWTKIHEISRAQLIDDSYQLYKLEIIPSPIVFLEMSKHLFMEVDPVSWVPAIRAFTELWTIMKNTDEAASFSTYVRGLMKSFTSEIGYEETSNDNELTTYARRELIKLACEIGEKTCTDATLRQMIEDLRQAKEISAELKDVIYREGMRTASPSIWNEALGAYGTHSKSQEAILSALGYSLNPENIKRLMETIVDRNVSSPAGHEFGLAALKSIYRGNGFGAILDFFEAKFEDLKKNAILWTWFHDRLVHMNVIITATDYQKILKFCSAKPSNFIYSYLCEFGEGRTREDPTKLIYSVREPVQKFLQSQGAKLITIRA